MVNKFKGEWQCNGWQCKGLFPIVVQLGAKTINAELNLSGVPWGYSLGSSSPQSRSGMLNASVVSVPSCKRSLTTFSSNGDTLSLEGILTTPFLLVVTNFTSENARVTLPFFAAKGFISSIYQSKVGLLRQESTSLGGDFSLYVEKDSSVIAFLKTESTESFTGTRSEQQDFLSGIELYQAAILGTGDIKLSSLVSSLLQCGGIASQPPSLDISDWLENYITQIDLGVRSLNEGLWHQKPATHRGLEVLNGGIAKVLGELSASRIRLHDRVEYNLPLVHVPGKATELASMAVRSFGDYSYNACSTDSLEVMPDPWL